MKTTEWKEPSLTWVQKFQHFNVEVIRRNGFASDHFGPYRWNVYAYIFPSHPNWEQLKQSSHELHLSGGCTYTKKHCDESGQINCIQYGSDYMHSWDTAHRCENSLEVFSDAEKLIAQLLIDQVDAAKTIH